jgi:antitoxin HicB
MDIRYPAKITKEGKVFLVEFIDLPDTFTYGETMEEALANAAEVLTAMLDVKQEDGIEIPAPSQNGEDGVLIAPDAKTQAAMLLRQARGERSLAEWARVMETSWDVAKRLENPNHWPSLRALDRAASALGKRLVLSLA